MNGSSNSYEEPSSPKTVPSGIKELRKKALSESDKAKIKKILGLTSNAPFPRCMGKKNNCKCTAGEGTRGDFYGLGEHTGNFGVGWCWHHQKYKGAKTCHEKAIEHMQALQAFGVHNMDGKVFERLAVVKAKEVEEANEINKGIALVLKTMEDFKALVESKELNEYVSGGKDGAYLAPASQSTRIDLALRIAKTLTSIKLDQFKMAADDYMHVSELTIRLPREITLAKRMFAKLVELKANYKDGERSPLEQIEEEYLLGMKEIWKDAKAGEKK
jgi:hypothetical protein